MPKEPQKPINDILLERIIKLETENSILAPSGWLPLQIK